MKTIIFNTEEVQATLARRKTQVRRVIKLKSGYSLEGTDAEIAENLILFGNAALYHNGEETGEVFKPRFEAGDIVFVKETWREFSGMFYGWEGGVYIPLDDFFGYNFKADDSHLFTKGANPFVAAFEDMREEIEYGKWRSPACMPKEAARIFLKVTGSRIERLQDITETQVRKEGFRDYLAADDVFYPCGYYFRQTWNRKIKKKDLSEYGWEANPLVEVTEFEVISKEEAYGTGQRLAILPKI